MTQMDDYISRQAAIERAVDIEMFGKKVKLVAVSELKAIPSADVVEVVRCKDCKFGRYDIFGRGMYCGREYVQLDTYEDDFCSFAERKMDGEQE